MCGIVGTVCFSTDRAGVDRALLERMRDRMAHRGPDGAGVWLDSDSRVGLAHRRLAIVDLDHRADQPMSTPDGRYTVVFNGELYNYRELRQRLTAAGVTDWRTSHSDTEVLLYAYRHWGEQCVEQFHGMFAFAVWDGRRRSLWCVRDRIGIKPLYFAQLPGRFNFASEIKALLLDPAQRREMDEEAFSDYLSFMSVPPPRTMFRGIQKLAGGCWLRVDDDGRVQAGRYWDALESAGRVSVGNDLPAEVREELREAVRLRAVSDVDVGVFLSGGLDSSLNAALFSRTEQSRVKTFTVGYHGENWGYRNELQHARLVADFVGAEHHEILLSEQDLVDFLPRMIDLQDEPIGDPVCMPLYFVSKLARDNGVIVAQVGEGADELFYGYPRWHHIIGLHRALDTLPAMAAGGALGALSAVGKGTGYLAETLRRRAKGEPAFWSGAEAFTSREKRLLLSDRLRQDLGQRSSLDALDDIRTRFARGTRTADLPTWMTFVDLSFRLPELLLMRVDKMSMGASIEGRVPFLDHRLVSRVLAMPTDKRLKLFRGKSLLKRAARGLVPDSIIDRPKQGFGVPITDWLGGRLRGTLISEVEQFLMNSDALDPGRTRELLRAGHTNHLWWLWNLAAWHRAFVREPQRV